MVECLVILSSFIIPSFHNSIIPRVWKKFRMEILYYQGFEEFPIRLIREAAPRPIFHRV